MNAADCYSTAPTIVARLATELAKHDPAAVDKVAGLVDSSPAGNITGAAYLLHLLGMDDSGNDHQRRAALFALADYLELTAVMLDLQSEADTRQALVDSLATAKGKPKQ